MIYRNYIYNLILVLLSSYTAACTSTSKENYFSADNPLIQYTGRIDFSNPKLPRFWAPGVYIRAKFKGSYCKIALNDQVLWGNSHNYLEIVIDNGKPFRMQTSANTNIITVAENLSAGDHTVLVCKDTEGATGYLEFVGFYCEKLEPLPAKPNRKIEFIGNSITCGNGSDLSVIPCGQGQWYDEHNAYMSYGPVTARALGAQWTISAYSGIGMIHSCCNLPIVMPQVFDKIDMLDDSLTWNFKAYTPDVVTICLGQNDGIQDSSLFCGAYVNFIERLRRYYPKAAIVCLTSPMANAELSAVLKKYLTGIAGFFRSQGDSRVYSYAFSRSFNNGCGGHPDMAQHQLIANELTAFLKSIMHW